MNITQVQVELIVLNIQFKREFGVRRASWLDAETLRWFMRPSDINFSFEDAGAGDWEIEPVFWHSLSIEDKVEFVKAQKVLYKLHMRPFNRPFAINSSRAAATAVSIEAENGQLAGDDEQRMIERFFNEHDLLKTSDLNNKNIRGIFSDFLNFWHKNQ